MKKALRFLFTIFLGIMIPIICLFSWIVWTIFFAGPDHPTDEEMIAFYMQNKEDLDQLAQMLLTETEIRAVFPSDDGCSFMNQEQQIDDTINERCNHYVQSFKQMGFTWAYIGKEPLRLPVSHHGLSVSGSSKGLFYSSSPPDLIVNDTDEDVGDYWDYGISFVYRHIEGHWYIFYERT